MVPDLHQEDQQGGTRLLERVSVPINAPHFLLTFIVPDLHQEDNKCCNYKAVIPLMDPDLRQEDNEVSVIKTPPLNRSKPPSLNIKLPSP